MDRIRDKNIFQFIKFGMVGCSNTVLSFLIYWMLIYFNVNYLIANTIAYIISSIWGYILNKKWVFRSKNEEVTFSILKYYIVYISSFIINLGGVHLLVDTLSIDKYIAPIFVMCVTIPYNFILNKLWAFRNKSN